MEEKIVQQLIARMSYGDQEAFKALFMEFQPKLLGFINGFIKDKEVSQDICQNIFFSLWKDRLKMSHIKDFEPYLFFIAKGAVCNYFDHDAVSMKYINHVLHSPLQTANAEEEIFAAELMRRIRKIVDVMPVKRRQVFRMSREKGLSNERISEELNISKRTVENHIIAALRSIRKSLKFLVFLIFLVGNGKV
jgi:RNA polymerase sigma-70 factor (family 1)